MESPKIKGSLTFNIPLNQLSLSDKKALAIWALKNINPGEPLGAELFEAISRLSVNVPYETVALRINPETSKMEVFLAWRDETAPAYKNTWHAPGTFVRPGEPEEQTLKRLAEREYGVPISVLKRVGWDNNLHEERGQCMHLVFLISILGESTRGKWFAVDALPPELVVHHRDVIIPMAIEAFDNG